jgi:hypothetical protein
VAQLVEALCYKSKGCGFDSSMESLEFFIDYILPAAWLWGRISFHQKGEPRVSLGEGAKAAVRRADNLATFTC